MMTATDCVACPVNWKRDHSSAGYLTLSFVLDVILWGGAGAGVLSFAIDREMFKRSK